MVPEQMAKPQFQNKRGGVVRYFSSAVLILPILMILSVSNIVLAGPLQYTVIIVVTRVLYKGEISTIIAIDPATGTPQNLPVTVFPLPQNLQDWSIEKIYWKSGSPIPEKA